MQLIYHLPFGTELFHCGHPNCYFIFLNCCYSLTNVQYKTIDDNYQHIYINVLLKDVNIAQTECMYVFVAVLQYG